MYLNFQDDQPGRAQKSITNLPAQDKANQAK